MSDQEKANRAQQHQLVIYPDEYELIDPKVHQHKPHTAVRRCAALATISR